MENLIEIIIEALEEKGYEAKVDDVLENVINATDEDSYVHMITIE